MIEFLDLEAYRDKLISGLPYGVRKVIELARALCTEPKLILLDEPSSGLNVEETDDMSFWIRDMKTELGITVLMVEHDITLVNRVSDRVIALNYGRVLAMGRLPKFKCIPTSSPRILERDGMSAPDIILKLSSIESFTGRSWRSGASGWKCRAADRDAAGGQRRRQDHGAEDHFGHSRSAKRLDRVLGQADPAHGGRPIVRLGLSHVPEGREVFPFFTVRENLMMGAYRARSRRRRWRS